MRANNSRYGSSSYVYVINPNPSESIRFSREEIKHLLISLLVLTMSFSFVFSGLTMFNAVDERAIVRLAWYIPIAFLAATTAFVLHELSHKIAAQRYGMWAEYRYNKQGLLFALFFSFLVGIVWAAPGAVYISGYPTNEQNGKISVAGPMLNITVAATFLGISLITNDFFVFIVTRAVCFVNIFLAAFNMLPLQSLNLDGHKVLRWNKYWFIGVYIIIAGLGALYFITY
jgi:Zn-dependent protease